MIKRSALAMAMTLAVACAGPALAADGDADAGEKKFKQRCAICHQVGEGAKTRPTGPMLNDVIGLKAGSREGFKYSKAMTKAGEDGIVWNAETLDKYLEKPRQYIKGNRMGFAGFKKEEDRANVIAYLKKFSDGQ